jgi:hypothetical protein
LDEKAGIRMRGRIRIQESGWECRNQDDETGKSGCGVDVNM